MGAIVKEVKVLPVPTNGWINGGWSRKLPQFRLLAEMLGLTQPSISPDELQVLFQKVASAKAFAESVQPFLEEVGKPRKWVIERLQSMEKQLGLLEPLPFMSLLGGIENPRCFAGVAIWPAGITNWTQLRLEQIRLARTAGAYFEHVVVLGSSRVCNTPADRRHPLIWDFPEGHEPHERRLQQILIEREAGGLRFIEPALPRANKDGRPLSLEQQLDHLIMSGQYEELIGDEDIYVPSTPNSLYVPLHVTRILKHKNVWLSQAGARPTRDMPDHFWPTLQDILTTPNGIIRFWVELLHAGCIKTEA